MLTFERLVGGQDLGALRHRHYLREFQVSMQVAVFIFDGRVDIDGFVGNHPALVAVPLLFNLKLQNTLLQAPAAFGLVDG